VPSPVNPPSGCRFRTRCPRFANDLNNTQREWCVNVEPGLEAKFDNHTAACHFAAARSDILALGGRDEEIRPTLAEWPTGTPTDEQASKAMVCMPDDAAHEPIRLGTDAQVDEEGQVVIDGETV
jgi:hypothetical protein